MTVKELRALLAKYPGDLLVMVQGYEGGLADVKRERAQIVEVHLDGAGGDYYGPHGEHDMGELSCYYCPNAADDKRNGETVKTLLLKR